MRRWFQYAGRSAAAVVAFCWFAASAHAISSAVNISTRMVVETGDNVLIGGFIVYGTGQKTVAVRAIGPSLPVQGALSDPVLELHDASGALIATNDNWRTAPIIVRHHERAGAVMQLKHGIHEPARDRSAAETE